jgi:S1-C subfamily serine protease
MPSQCTEATVSAADAGLDLAVLFINTSNLPYVAIGDSDAVTAGHPVDALGYPFGPGVEVGKIATAATSCLRSARRQEPFPRCAPAIPASGAICKSQTC